MLASNGCRREVAFLRRNEILMLLYFPTRLSGCTRALSKNSKIFQFSSFIMLLSFCSTFSIITICIQDFASAKKETYPSFDAAFASLKQRGLLLFVIISLITLPPLALAINATVILLCWFFRLKLKNCCSSFQLLYTAHGRHVFLFKIILLNNFQIRIAWNSSVQNNRTFKMFKNFNNIENQFRVGSR